MHKTKQSYGRSAKSMKLRKEVVSMLNHGWTPAAIRHEIVTADCDKIDKALLLKELHLEEER